jgi:hypothetical protein
MPQLVKGGKWVFGWVIVGEEGTIAVPPEAWQEYGFAVGESVVFLPGSSRSGGFGLSCRRLLENSPLALDRDDRVLGRGQIDEPQRVTIPAGVGVQLGQRLLVVRGSGHALGFVQKGPIYETALEHPEIQVFSAA